MDPRLRLHNVLKAINGVETVCFQPKSSTVLKYPAIVYQRDNSYSVYANNKMYLRWKRYQVTVIDRNPDSIIPDQVEKLTSARFERSYAIDGLNHYVFNVFV